MARDSLLVLQSLRLRTVTAARATLSACLAAEGAAAQRISAIVGEATRDLAASVPEAHRFTEMFARRSEVRRMDLAAAAAELETARERSAAARGMLVAARTEAETVATLIGERAAAATAAEGRQEQHRLDDISRSRGNG